MQSHESQDAKKLFFQRIFGHNSESTAPIGVKRMHEIFCLTCKWCTWTATICKQRFVSPGPSRIATQLSGVSWRTSTNLALKSTPWEAKTRLSVWITSLAWHLSRRWRPASWQTDALAKNISPTPKRRLTLWWSNCWRRTTRTSTISSATSCWTLSSAMTPTN